jgi:hypothetical protein
MVLLAGGCGSGGSGTGSNRGGVASGNAGAAGGGGWGAGGEPAAGGATGAAAGAGDGAYGPGAAGGGWPGTSAGGASGGAGSSAGAGGNSTGGATGGGGVAGTTWLTPPPVPPVLEPPAGATVKLHAHAVGAQIYTCAASGGAGADAGADAGATTYAWVLRAPDALLFDAAGTQVGTHGAGPSWMWRDGSAAVGAKVAELPSPSADAISWLLLRVTSTSGAGMLSDATYVQRLDTTGGRAPATGCDATTVGTETRSAYSADYYFYAGGGGATWLAPPQVPDAIAAPNDVTLAVHDRGIGVQIYNCAASTDASGTSTYAWAFKAPDALLYDQTFAPVGSHGAGPSWLAQDGSAVEAREIARADAPRAGAVPWLLLKELAVRGDGVFGNVAFVQRIDTAGGVAPAYGCDASTANTEVRVPYSADYYFYVAKDRPDAGARD